MKTKSNKLHIIITVCLAIAVVVLASVLALRGCGEQGNESSADVSVNTEVSETVSNNDVSTEVSEEISEEVSEEVSDPEVSVPEDHTHKYADTWKSNETDHWKECECGNKSDIASHTFGEWTTTKEATEDAAGSKKHTCTLCGYEETAIIPALSHTHKYADTWKSNETDHWKECNCGNKSDVASHDYGEWTTTKEATEEAEGSKYHTCNTCGYKETVVTPTTESSTPESSDDKKDDENSSDSNNELEFSTDSLGRLYAVIFKKDLAEGRQAVKDYVASYAGKTPKTGKTEFNGNEILDFYNEAFLAVMGSRNNWESDRFVASRYEVDHSYILYDEESLSLPYTPFSWYAPFVGEGEALLEELCEYYFSHFTDEAAIELFPELVLYKGRLYDIVNDGYAGAASVRQEEKYKVSENNEGYEIQVSVYISPADIEMYDMYTKLPTGLNKETGENVFTYSIIMEDGVWVFNTSTMHSIYATPDYGRLNWEFTY